MEESEVPKPIPALYERLKKSAQLRKRLLGREVTPEERVIERIDDKPTALAKSEFFVTAGELDTLNEKVNAVRYWMQINGTDIALHPDSEDLSPEYGKRLWVDIKPFFALIDIVEPTQKTSLEEEKEQYKLSLNIEEEDKEIGASFGFSNDFALEIRFISEDPAQESLEYRSATRPLDQMTVEEYEIIDDYLNQLIQKVTWSTP